MSSPDLCFVSAVGGSVFMEELLEAVADAVRRAGGNARTVTGLFPEPGPDTVYVVVPHEYFVVTPEELRPPPRLRRRTVGFGVEHPGTRTFDRTASILPTLGGAIDINADSVAEFRRLGITARHFQLGYSPLWAEWDGDPETERTVDVTYLGTAERRRSRLLGSYWRDIDHLDSRLLTPPHEPMRGARVDFLPGREKLRHLSRSRILLNLHRELSVAVEWLRIVEALCNGCVVVTEPCRDLDPLVPGEHLVVASPAALGAAAAALAARPEQERKIRQAAYDFVRTELDMRHSAAGLVDLACDVLAGSPSPAPMRRIVRLVGPPADEDAPLAVDTPPADPRLPSAVPPDDIVVSESAQAAVEQAGLEMVHARLHGGTSWSAPELVDPVGQVDVLIVRRPGEPDPGRLAVDLARGTVAPRSILICTDGGGGCRVTAAHSLLRHELPMGRGYARDTLLGRTQAPWLLVVDPGLRASPYLLERFLGAGRHAAVVLCPVADPVDGLTNALPPEDRRLRMLPYLGSGYLVRRSLVTTMAGWTTEPLLDGLEDHVFWRSVAGAGVPSALVQQVLLSRLHPDRPVRPVDLDPARVWRELERHVQARVAAVRGVDGAGPEPAPADEHGLTDHARDAGDPWVPDNPYFRHAEQSMDRSWHSLIWPMIGGCDLSSVIDLAAGHGRNSVKLRAAGARRILVLDIQRGNVDRCRERFAGDPAFEFGVTNGYNLEPAEDEAYSLVYCFDAMVHFHRDVVRAYLADTARVLKPGGHGFFHHSNYTGGDSWHDNPASRAYLSREMFRRYATEAGLDVVEQRVLPWYGWPALDCLTLVRKPTGGRTG